MKFDLKLFKELDKQAISKVRIGNGEYIEAKGRWTVAIIGHSCSKIVSDVLYVIDINQNLLSVG